MKKHITLLLALVMSLSLALCPAALAEKDTTVGWDPLKEKEREAFPGFSLTLTQLEYDKTLTGLIVNDIDGGTYERYSPANKGVVLGTPIRMILVATLPSKAELTDAEWQIVSEHGISLEVKPKNISFTSAEGISSLGGGKAEPLSDFLYRDSITRDGRFVMDGIALDRDEPLTISIMLTGRVTATADATAEASLSYGYSDFEDGVFEFVNGEDIYRAEHLENGFYIKNLTRNGAYTVRYSVNSLNKITDVAVSANDDYTESYEMAYSIGNSEALEKYNEKQNGYLCDNLSLLADIYSERLISDGVLERVPVAYTNRLTVYKYKLTGSTSPEDVVIAVGELYRDYADDAFKPLDKAAANKEAASIMASDPMYLKNAHELYEIVTMVTPLTYELGEDSKPKYVKLWSTYMKYGYISTIERERNGSFFSASMSVDTGRVVFAHGKSLFASGFTDAESGNSVYNGALIPTKKQLSSYGGDPVPLEGTTRAVTRGYGRIELEEDVLSSGAEYDRHLFSLDESFALFGFEWDGGAKYFQEKHITSRYGLAPKTAAVTYLGYTNAMN